MDDEQEQRGYRMFYVLPDVVFERYDISANAKILYAHILSLSRKNGYCYATNKYFAKYHHKSKSAIKKWIKELSDTGLLDSIVTYKKDSLEVEHRYLQTKLQFGFKEYSDTPGLKNDPTPGSQKCPENYINNIYSQVDNFATPHDVIEPSNSRAKSTTRESKCEQIHRDIIEYFNEKCGAHYRPETPLTIKLINRWLKAGYTLADFMLVIDNKFDDWFESVKYRKYLRPSTLFGSKFEEYKNQIPKDVEPGCVREYYPSSCWDDSNESE